MSLASRVTALSARIAAEINALRAERHYIVWAEQNGQLRDNYFEWSFGAGQERQNQHGLLLMRAGRITQVALSVVQAPRSSCDVEVLITKKGETNKRSAGHVTLRSGVHSDADYVPPFVVDRGDLLQFRTVLSGNANRGVVSVEISY